MNMRESIGRRERRKERTRQVLIDASIALFMDRGIYGTRIEDITERADLGKGAFYNYFDSKNAIVTEILSDGVNLLDRDYLSRLDDGGSLAARVAALVSLHQDFFDEHPHYVLLFHQARGMLQIAAIGQREPTRDVRRLPRQVGTFADIVE
jgi:AcrR family transcriptional regulator